MDAFGLNIVFNFVDNASSGMMGVVGVFNQVNSAVDSMTANIANSMQVFQSMAIVGSSLESLGNQALSMGERVASSLGKVATSVVDVGNQMFNARLRINQLFKDSVGGGEAMLDWISQYAKTSVFEFEDVLDGALMMKTAMIDVRDTITSTTGQTKQNVLDYASDLAAFNPQAHNMYGNGVEAAMGAIKEYVAEGNAKSLQMGFSLDITGILGENKGGTAEERMQQVADLIEKVGMAGMTSSLEGTAQNQISNLSDTFFILKSKIADSGIFDFYTEMVTQISEAFAIGDEEMDVLAKTFADALMELAEPIRFVISGFKELILYVRELAQEHPEIFKLGVKIATVGASLLIVSGIALTAVGAFMKLTAGLGMIGISGTSISGVLAGVGTAVAHLSAVIAPLIVAVVSLKYAWDNNIFGMRDTLSRAFGDIYDTLRITFQFLKEGGISLEDYNLAESMGILPFIQAMLNLQHAWGTFVDGFKSGFEAIHQGFQEFASQFEPIIIPIREAFGKIGEALNKCLGPDNEDKWKRFGEIIGKVAGIASIVVPIIMGIVKVVGLIANPVGLIVTAVVGLILGIKYAWDNNLGDIQGKTQAFIEWFKSTISTIQEKLAPLHAFTKGLFDKCVEAIKSSISKAKEDIQPIIKFISDRFKKVGEVFKEYIVPTIQRSIEMARDQFQRLSPIIQRVSGWFKKAFDKVAEITKATFGKISEWTKTISDKMKSWIQKAMEGPLGKAIDSVTEFIGKVIDTLSIIAKWVYDKVIVPITEFFAWLSEVVEPYVQPVIDYMGDALGKLWSFIVDLFGNIASFFVDTFGNIFNVVCEVFSGIVGIFTGIVDFIAGVFSGDWARAWEGIVEVFTSIWDTVVGVIKGVINAVINAINFCIRGINSLEVPDWVNELVGHEVSINIPEIPALSTGGEVKKEGLSVIHPAEVVVNSDTTTQLKKFLSNQLSGKGAVGGGDVVLHFDRESVVMRIDKADDNNLDSVAERLISVIMRKLERRKMAIRNPIV